MTTKANDTLPTGAQPAEIYERPDDYDLEHEGDDEDARFYTRLLRRLHPVRVVEFACGSGRLTRALAMALPHAEIIGVDSSAAMLESAARQEPRCPQITYEEGDMRQWHGFSGSFDVVVLAGRSASHLLSLDDRLATWRNAFRLLRPGGAFVIDVAIPDLAILAESQRTWPRAQVQFDLDASRHDVEDTRLLRCTATTYSPHEQRADVRYFYDRLTPDTTGRFVSDFQSHIYFPSELELLFTTCGFAIGRQYGDYAFSPVTRTSPYLISVAFKPEEA